VFSYERRWTVGVQANSGRLSDAILERRQRCSRRQCVPCGGYNEGHHGGSAWAVHVGAPELMAEPSVEGIAVSNIVPPFRLSPANFAGLTILDASESVAATISSAATELPGAVGILAMLRQQATDVVVDHLPEIVIVGADREEIFRRLE
jgi:hypothetical protein